MWWELQRDSLLRRSSLFCERVSVWAMLLAIPPPQVKQPDSLLPQSLFVSERVSVWAMLLVTPPRQVKQLSRRLTLSLQTFCACDVFLLVIPPG